MDRLPFAYVVLALALGAAAIAAWILGFRYFRDRTAELSVKDRAIGFLLAGPFFGPLHASMSARGYRLSAREKVGLAVVVGIALVIIVGALFVGYGERRT